MKRLCFDLEERALHSMRGMAAEEGCDIGELLTRALALYRAVRRHMLADPGAKLVFIDSSGTTERRIPFPPRPPIPNRTSQIVNRK